MSNIGDFMKGVDGSLGVGRTASALPGTSVAQPVVNQAFDIFAPPFTKAADGAAGTATADTIIFNNPYDFTLYVQSAKIVATSGTLTADNTNFATITIKTDNAAAGATAVALTLTTAITDSGNWAALIAKNFTAVTGANIALLPGANLYINIAKSGAGVVVPASITTVRLRRGEY